MEVIVNEGGTVQRGRKSYGANAVLDVPTKEAERLAALGAVSMSGRGSAPPKDDGGGDNVVALPEDIPGRAALAEAGLTLEDVGARVAAGTILEVPGIGEAKGAALVKWWNERTAGD